MSARDTLAAFVAAAQKSATTYAGYQRLEGSERTVWAAQKAESEALKAHIEAIAELERRACVTTH